jgi:hypothetical protein
MERAVLSERARQTEAHVGSVRLSICVHESPLLPATDRAMNATVCARALAPCCIIHDYRHPPVHFSAAHRTENGETECRPENVPSRLALVLKPGGERAGLDSLYRAGGWRVREGSTPNQ